MSNQKTIDQCQKSLGFNIISWKAFYNLIMNTQQQLQLFNNEGKRVEQQVAIKSFEDFNLKYDLVRGIYDFGFEEPSLIQRKGIPIILQKRDCIIQGQSGTGKTATFMISALQMIQKSPYVQCLVMTPTRELAYQHNIVGAALNAFLKVNIKSFYGGTDVRQDRKALQNNEVNIAIGTPGRLKQMIEKKWLNTDHIKLVILDEADEMIVGFEEAMRDIFAELPSDTQVCLVSATMPKEVVEITEHFMKEPIKLLLSNMDVRVKGIKQFYIPMNEDSQKFGTLIQLYKNIEITQSIVFTNTKQRVLELAEKLQALKFPLIYLTGDMTTEERKKVMSAFRTGEARVLIATDLVGRGIDVQQVNLVINYDLPSSTEKYTHRIGRAGRLGRKGVAINLVTSGDAQMLAQLESEYGHKMEELPLDLSKIYD